MQLHFPVSTSIFEHLVRRESSGEHYYTFVDKTLFIKKVLENPDRISLIIRPRRFGKSTNMDMLACFLDIRTKAENKNLFHGLKIAEATLSNGVPCMEHYGKYPVIFMNFKTLGQNSYQEFYEMFKNMVYELYLQHDYLLNSNTLKDAEKEIIQAVINRNAEEQIYKTALKKLITYLQRHFGERVVVLIDEYDTPFQQAIHQRMQTNISAEESFYGTEPDYFESLKTLMATFLGDALKDNRDLENCVMTGIVRIAGAGIFSQLNNIDVYTVLDKKFAEYFGFTQEEVNELLEKTGRLAKAKEFSRWYNGYEFANHIIYNPLSVMKCLDRDEFRSYWLGSSNNTLIHHSLLKPRDENDHAEINQAVAQWIAGKVVKKSIDEQLIFDSNLNTIEHLWILLLSSGYLKVTNQEMVSDKIECQLEIPNREVFYLYKNVFNGWLNNLGVRENSPMIQYLLNGDAEGFGEKLKQFFKTVVSVRDGTKQAVDSEANEKYEAFYHGFMVGVLGLSLSRFNVKLQSNGESGYGYYDLLMSPRNPQHRLYNKAIIFEFKRATEKENIKKAAAAALQQIKTNEYHTNILEHGVNKVVFIGVAFRGKQIEYKHETCSIDKLNIKKTNAPEQTATFLEWA